MHKMRGMRKHGMTIALVTVVLLASWQPAFAVYKAVTPKTALAEGEVAVTKPGCYAEDGKTYVLMNDVSSPTSAIFLGKNVTLDLNGHTITYADGPYQHVPNYSFEEGLTGWDTSRAPGAQVKDTSMLHPLCGKMTCTLPAGQEIISRYINLPVANRSYYATAMVAKQGQYVTISVDDEQGNPVKCIFQWGDQTRVTCPAEKFSTRLGGGTVYALMYGMPAGKYRVRVKAVDQDAVIDYVDIRPVMDVGIGIVGKIIPWAYYKCVVDEDPEPAFFDYRKKGTAMTVADEIPRVTGAGTVTVRNGVIASGSEGVYTRGILSTAQGVKTVIENVKFVSAGINANAIQVFHGVMKNCRVEVDTPFIVQRHTRSEVAACFAGREPSEIFNCEFYGGQGCLTINGQGGLVHNNLFVNNQTVTNHYSLSLDADGAKVYKNRFEPKQGSGIYIYTHRDNEVYDNIFKIAASPPINEYSTEDYSTNAIRISDYNARKGNPKGWCDGNKIHNNVFQITGKAYPKADPRYKPVATALFVSVGGGANYVYDNQIVIDHQDPGYAGADAYAFYIGGSDNGGAYYDNTITTNVTPIWIASRYGSAGNVEMYNNTIIKAKGAADFVPVICGEGDNLARNVGFYSNEFVGVDFAVKMNDAGGKASQYEFGWTLTVKTEPNAKVTVTDQAGAQVLAKNADSQGVLVARLAEYKVVDNGKVDCSTYTVKAGDTVKSVSMKQDLEVAMK